MSRNTYFGLGLLAVGCTFSQSSPQAPRPKPQVPTIHLQSPLEGVIPEVTSSFGERRLTHFHSGYDFSTNKENGWRVVAPADGEIYRMKVERRGYGRALYIRHAGGFSTTYGHLFAFEDEVLGLEKRLKSAQASGGRFPGDIYPDPPIKVKAGQLVALAGEAGVGMPHLHFELRLNEEPVDPAVYSDLVVDGTGRVEIPALWATGIMCEVTGGEARMHRPGIYEIPLHQDEKGVWRATAIPTINDLACRLALEARDVGGRPRAVNELEVSIDGQSTYRYLNHHFDFVNYFEAGWIFNPDASNGGRFVYNLSPQSNAMLFKGVAYRKFDNNKIAFGEHRLDASARALGGEAQAQVQYKAYSIINVKGHNRTWKKWMATSSGAFTKEDGSIVKIDTDDWVHLSVLPKTTVSYGVWNVMFPAAGLPDGDIAVQSIPYGDVNLTPNPDKTPAVEFIPSDFYTREPMILSVNSPDTSHTDIYFWDDNKNKWEPMNAVKGAGVLTSKLRGLGKFALFEDHVAPVVSALQSREEPKLNLRRWYWPATDIGEGIDVEGCRATVNRKAAGAPEVEYDPDREWVQFYRPLDWQPPKGLSVSCTDRAGNSSSGVKRRPLKRWHRKKRRG